jgi:hypothetical protein
LSQLDELEAELEDLRKQIDRETEDARRIREEVMYPENSTHATRICMNNSELLGHNQHSRLCNSAQRFPFSSHAIP